MTRLYPWLADLACRLTPFMGAREETIAPDGPEEIDIEAADGPIMGKIAAILNRREVVISVGSDAGVELHMIFKIMEEPIIVKDPGTDEVLGTMCREKARVKVSLVDTKFAVARTFTGPGAPLRWELPCVSGPFTLAHELVGVIVGDVVELYQPVSEA